MKYKILTGHDVNTFEKVIMRYIEEGYTLYGSPFSTAHWVYNQAVIRE